MNSLEDIEITWLEGCEFPTYSDDPNWLPADVQHFLMVAWSQGAPDSIWADVPNDPELAFMFDNDSIGG